MDNEQRYVLNFLSAEVQENFKLFELPMSGSPF